MNKKFGGFTEQQMESLARKMGFKGSMNKFNEFLAASPGKAAELQRYSQKAREFVEGVPHMAKGGEVKKPQGKKDDKKPNKPVYKKTPQEEKRLDSINDVEKISAQAIKNPQNLITEAENKKIDFDKDQLIKKNAGEWHKAHTIQDPGKVGHTSTANTPKKTEANTYKSTQVGEKVEDVVDDTKTVQGKVSAGAKVEAATALPSANATVSGQLEKLMSQFEGGQAPPWAQGAMRMAETVMASRGMGASSMAGSAITQAAMESAIQIAVQDAQTFSQFEMQNLNNRQQARLQNAQAFLQMDLANLDIANQTNLFKSQALIQGLFTDQAAANAAKQFNATSENQTDQFFAQLKTQVAQFNAAQKNGMRQFNVEQENAVKMFNKEVLNARAQFNATQRLVIDQANAKWRQTIATQDNAQINENNRLNAQLATNMTSQAYNNLWQTERDIMAFAFTAAENAAERANNVVIAKLASDNKSTSDTVKGNAAGTLVGKIIDRGVDYVFDRWF